MWVLLSVGFWSNSGSSAAAAMAARAQNAKKRRIDPPEGQSPQSPNSILPWNSGIAVTVPEFKDTLEILNLRSLCGAGGLRLPRPLAGDFFTASHGRGSVTHVDAATMQPSRARKGSGRRDDRLH